MRDLLPALSKIFVREYYRLNAGFFMVVITLAFGFMSGKEHRALAQFFTASPTLLLIPISIWSIYTIKIIVFNQQRFTVQENSFVFLLRLVPLVRQVAALYVPIISQLMPVLLYAAFLLLTAIANGQFQIMAMIMAACLVLTSLATVSLWGAIRQRHEPKISWLKNYIDLRLARPYYTFYITWVFRSEPVMIFATKIFGCGLIFAVASLYHAEAYDWRLMAMGISLAASGQFMLLLQMQRLEYQMPLIRNLPLTILKRTTVTWLTFAVLLTPELIFIWKYFPGHLSYMTMLSAMIFLISISILHYGITHVNFNNPESFGRWAFGIEIAMLVLILFGVDLVLLSVVNLVSGTWLFFRNYYRFEFGTGGISE